LQIRDWFYALITPLARPLMRFHPTAITVAAVVVGCLAGAAYALAARGSWLYLAGGVLALVSGLADAFDGIVARETGRTSTMGDFLDHFGDRLVEIALLAGLAAAPAATTSFGLAVVILVLLNSYLGTQLEASFGRRDYTGLGKGQLFVGLVVVSVALAVAPEAVISLAARSVSVLDLFFALVGLATVQAITHRLRQAFRSARAGEEP
jgi:phosphatidylglycerophosphate synthase